MSTHKNIVCTKTSESSVVVEVRELMDLSGVRGYI